MKLGDVLKKERLRRDLSTAEVSRRLDLPEQEYQQLEAGQTEAEKWGPVLAWIAITLETPTSRLVTESGRFADAKCGQTGELIRQHRERREKSPAEMAGRITEELSQYGIEVSLEEYQQIEAGSSPLERLAPLLLGFAEIIEQPVFNLFYPCGLPFQELDDYP